MAGLYDKQAAIYADARPTFPSEWFTKLAALTPHHSLAWDAGTGNGQAALSIAEHYDKVIATDISEEQLKHGTPNPKVQYLHTPSTMSDDETVRLIGGENSVDLVTVSVAVHWFDLERFYSQVKRVLKKPGGVIAVWTYNIIQVNSEFDPLMWEFYKKSLPFQHPKAKYAFDCYKTLPFPFESVGVGCEGEPIALDLKKEMSFEGFIGLIKSWSAVSIAKEKGVDLLNQHVIEGFETAWGGSHMLRNVIFKTYMLAGKVNP
ncbi:S-adenosyl-L-methionine-dependent methyltransferases superfamily protein [Euphorbia peplus]|nr:S-adenosyl-L-methionine-dependent methyltransferases superfamily protein [Euphorbia peplus]